MNWTSVIRTAIVCLILIVLHYTLRPLLAWRASIDFLLIALVFGAGALAATIVGFSASWLKAVFFADNLALNAFFLFIGKWVFDLVYVLMERRMHGTEMLMQIIVWSPLAAAVTAVAGVIAITVLRPILEVRTA